ncbi:MAG: hypothetical protein OXG44_15140 [Gammaproteobacteria bacterium]|nr:hypothetical protein [Gammaproteobacteria bacterium]
MTLSDLKRELIELAEKAHGMACDMPGIYGSDEAKAEYDRVIAARNSLYLIVKDLGEGK